MRWFPVVFLLAAIAVAVIIARGLPEDYSSASDPELESPTDSALQAVRPERGDN